MAPIKDNATIIHNRERARGVERERGVVREHASNSADATITNMRERERERASDSAKRRHSNKPLNGDGGNYDDD
jgi:hypothetical protein